MIIKNQWQCLDEKVGVMILREWCFQWRTLGHKIGSSLSTKILNTNKPFSLTMECCIIDGI